MPHEEKNRKVTNSQLNEDLSCNHVETDTRQLLEGRKSKHPAVITASDTDVLALMHYAHQQLSPQNDQLMKIDSERYVSVISIKLYF